MITLELLKQLPLSFIYICVALLGLILGSFFNVVIYRLPIIIERLWNKETSELSVDTYKSLDDGQKSRTKYLALEFKKRQVYNLWTPRSACPHCAHTLSAWENIPVLSYLILRGRCWHCAQSISCRYPLVELISATLGVYLVQHFGLTMHALLALVFSWILLILALIDADTHLLPDCLTLPLLWLGLLSNISAQFVPLADAVLGASAGYLILWSIYWIFKWLRNKEGMGYGDFKLLAALGAWLGWQALPQILLLASICGTLFGIIGILLKRHRIEQAMAFGPFLASAGFITLVMGNYFY